MTECPANVAAAEDTVTGSPPLLSPTTHALTILVLLSQLLCCM